VKEKLFEIRFASLRAISTNIITIENIEYLNNEKEDPFWNEM